MPKTIRATPVTASMPKQRVDWVDHAKGICIILVVMMHSTLGVEAAMGTVGKLNTFVEWARPFRMPDFFLISGLFLMRRIDAPWATYIDKKVVHFLYFYLLWMTIQFLFKGFGIYQVHGAYGLLQQVALAFIEPFGTLWFIYLLPLFFVLTKLLRGVAPIAVFAIAAMLEMLPIHTGWIMIDEFAAKYVYFFAGYWLARHVFAFASGMAALGTASLVSALAVWAMLHTQLFQMGYAGMPGIGLALGFLGAGAVISAAVLLTRLRWGEALRFIGENSIVVYLSFFVFMAFTRTVLVRFTPQLGSDLISLITTLAAVVGPLVLLMLTRGTPFSFLFKRPSFATVERWSKLWQTGEHDRLARKPQAR